MGEEKRVLELIEKEFASLVKDKRELPGKNKFVWDNQKDKRTKLVSRKVEQAAVVMAFRGIDMNDERRFSLELLNIILGDGMTSRLFKEVREERGWAYGVGSDVGMFTDAGEVFIGAGLPKNKLKEAVELITEICYGLGEPKSKWVIKREELEVARRVFWREVGLSDGQARECSGRGTRRSYF